VYTYTLANIKFNSLPVLFVAIFTSFNLHYSTMFCIFWKQTVTYRHLQTVKVKTGAKSTRKAFYYRATA